MCNPPGRPKTTHCKRGHERVPGEVTCRKCRRLREQWKYHENEAFRERKKAYQRQWRRDFFTAHGYWASHKYDRKTSNEVASAI